MGEENDGLEGLEIEMKLKDLELDLGDKVAEEVKDAIEEVKERKIYQGKKNYRGLDYVAGQEPKHAAMLKMQIRGVVAWLDGEDKMSYKDVVMLPYADFMDLLKQFAEANKIEGASF